MEAPEASSWTRVSAAARAAVSANGKSLTSRRRFASAWRRLLACILRSIPTSSSPQPGPPLLVPINCGGRRVVAVIDRIRTVAKELLERLIGELVADDLEAVEDGLRQIPELG